MNTEEKKIAVIGIGGVGGYIAGLLAKAYPHVTMVARGARAESIRKKGLVLHSDIEKICSYYNLKKENIVKFGANVNPLGLSPKAGRAIAEHVDILSSYPDREYTSLRNTISSYCNIPGYFRRRRALWSIQNR